MGDIQFESDRENEFGAPAQGRSGFDLVGLLVQTGLVENRQMGQYILVGVAVLAFAVMFFVFFSSGRQTPPPPPPNMAVGQPL
jgi:hypothetical protein